MERPDRYGALELPEDSTHVEVRENPVQLARAAYRAWLPTAQRNPLTADREHAGLRQWQLWNDDLPLCERLYQHAIMHVAPLAPAFEDVRPRELQAIIKAVRPEDASTSGLYLSALLNAAGLPMLAGEFRHNLLGWRLAGGKTLIAREGSRVSELGRYSHGTLINHGVVRNDMGAHAENGLTVNLGTVTEELGRDAAGINVNANRAADLGSSADRGIHLNYGCIQTFGDSATGGTHVNLGEVEGNAACTDGGVHINYGRVRGWYGYASNLIAFDRGRCDDVVNAIEPRWCKDPVQVERLLEDLKRELKPLAALKKLRDEPRKADRFILGYDWNGLERRVEALRKDIEDRVRR